MAIRQVVKIGDDVLRKTSRPVDVLNRRILTLLDDMAETMYAKDGVGLAAPQVGVLRRIVVIDVGEGLVELINPVILEASGHQEGPEGCLSLPGKHGTVARPDHVKVRALDRKGREFELEADGFFARAVCHELDHLDGRVYIDVMDRELTPEEIEGHVPEDDNE